MTTFLTTPQGRHIAYHRTPGREPGVVFLGGFRSDMTGSKALHLQAWAEATGRSFLRFDYSGHGASRGVFEELALSDWRADAAALLEVLTEGPQVLVGSSMGGWIALLLARDMPEKVAGLVGIAAAPDFTERMWDEELTLAERTRLMEDGIFYRPSDYSADPYPITRRLIEDGRENLVLRSPLHLPIPVRLLQGTADVDVPPAVAVGLLDHISSPDLRLTLVKEADHRFSTPACLALLTQSVEEVLAVRDAGQGAEGTEVLSLTHLG
ncbi:alpha/beta hydrolase [Tabrizicola aquatica]|uniref:alpha/beta hydrolase n=1 Tax=Tabrizicola aquatica TaxID=909926 RepID=UPI000CD13B95|nr:alpha/beta hydrolase [Tabrizicola aquatica]